MGSLISSLTSKQSHLCIVSGVENSGKTTILHKLDSTPKVGFAFETVEYKNFTMIILAPVVSAKIKPLTDMYYQTAKAILFVVDSSDKEKLINARDDIHEMLSDEL